MTSLSRSLDQLKVTGLPAVAAATAITPSLLTSVETGIETVADVRPSDAIDTTIASAAPLLSLFGGITMGLASAPMKVAVFVERNRGRHLRLQAPDSLILHLWVHV